MRPDIYISLYPVPLTLKLISKMGSQPSPPAPASNNSMCQCHLPAMAERLSTWQRCGTQLGSILIPPRGPAQGSNDPGEPVTWAASLREQPQPSDTRPCGGHWGSCLLFLKNHDGSGKMSPRDGPPDWRAPAGPQAPPACPCPRARVPQPQGSGKGRGLGKECQAGDCPSPRQRVLHPTSCWVTRASRDVLLLAVPSPLCKGPTSWQLPGRENLSGSRSYAEPDPCGLQGTRSCGHHKPGSYYLPQALGAGLGGSED